MPRQERYPRARFRVGTRLELPKFASWLILEALDRVHRRVYIFTALQNFDTLNAASIVDRDRGVLRRSRNR